jgi:hypothetical protein
LTRRPRKQKRIARTTRAHDSIVAPARIRCAPPPDGERDARGALHVGAGHFVRHTSAVATRPRRDAVVSAANARLAGVRQCDRGATASMPARTHRVARSSMRLRADGSGTSGAMSRPVMTQNRLDNVLSRNRKHRVRDLAIAAVLPMVFLFSGTSVASQLPALTPAAQPSAASVRIAAQTAARIDSDAVWQAALDEQNESMPFGV